LQLQNSSALGVEVNPEAYCSTLCFQIKKKLVVSSRDDRIVDFYYPIISCFWKIISVSDANPVLVQIILTVSENYPKVYYGGKHSLHFCVGLFCLTRQNNWSYFAFSWTRLA